MAADDASGMADMDADAVTKLTAAIDA